MSTDYAIKKQHLEDAGVIFSDDTCEFTGDPTITVKLPGYEYLREVWMSDNQATVNICCGGEFRNWIDAFLEKNEIEHEKH